MREIISFACYSTCLIFVGLVYGVLIGIGAAPPWTLKKIVVSTRTQAQDFLEEWRNDLGVEPSRLLVPAGPSKRIRMMEVRGRKTSGYRVIAGLMTTKSYRTGAIVLDAKGREIHDWEIDYGRLADDKSARLVFMHGLAVLPDGSLVVNFDEGEVLARINRCGDVLWKTAGEFHHVVSQSFDGTLWTWERDNIVQIDAKTGARIKNISLVEDIIKPHGLEAIFAIRTGNEPKEILFPKNFAHPNDVEVLSADMADKFPMFAAGDLLISLRELNMVAVIDKENNDVKWHRVGPWHRQHDPDFVADGTISLLNNNMGLGDSQILKVHPGRQSVEVVFEGTPKYRFYTWRRGKHQYLENGHIIVTDSESGRAFEVGELGEVVWEYVNIYDEKRNGILNKVMLLSEKYFRSGALTCNQRQGHGLNPKLRTGG